jgi:superfamily II DNA/RNA helicase
MPSNHFADFALDERLMRNITALGYDVPTPIQDQTIELGLAGKDIVGIADTGTGKTAAFMLPIIHALLANQHTKALIVAPTRELAQQIEEAGRSIGKGTGLTSAVLIGGSAYGPQLRDLRANPRIVIGTPGRLHDHIERGTLDLSSHSIVVLDEVDRMLDMGFVQPVTALLGSVAATHQTYYFSATLDGRVSGLIRTFSPTAETITVKSGDTSEQVHQDVIWYAGKAEKLEKLHDVLITRDVQKAIVFEETQRGVERLEQNLAERGFKVASMHGGKSQAQRTRALKGFKEGEVGILLATDVAARGIDVADVSHVINFTQPQTYEDYVHRIGRAGRAGSVGYALTFVEK